MNARITTVLYYRHVSICVFCYKNTNWRCSSITICDQSFITHQRFLCAACPMSICPCPPFLYSSPALPLLTHHILIELKIPKLCSPSHHRAIWYFISRIKAIVLIFSSCKFLNPQVFSKKLSNFNLSPAPLFIIVGIINFLIQLLIWNC